jgi:GT2 family glycosyltransferase
MTTSSVIVVSFRPGTWLEPCLRSVIDQADEVIVVDNASASRQATTIAEKCGARPVPVRQNLGFAGGVAAGLGEAQGDVIGVLNDDATAGATWLSSATSALGDPNVAAVTPKVLLAGAFAEVLLHDEPWFAPRDPRPLGRQIRSVTVGKEEVLAAVVGSGVHDLETTGEDRWRWTAGRKPIYVPFAGTGTIRIDGDPVEPSAVVRVLNHAGSYLRAHGTAGEHGFGAPDDGRFDSPAERFGFSGTAPVFRAETLRRLGAFAPQFFAYNEDTDWCLRARLAGLKVLYEPGGVVEHRFSATSGGAASEQVRVLAQRNALLCLLRNAPAGVAYREVSLRLRRDWRGPVGRAVARKLPWALATRAALSRQWQLRPHQVWDSWVERDATWDDGPAVSAPPGAARPLSTGDPAAAGPGASDGS